MLKYLPSPGCIAGFEKFFTEAELKEFQEVGKKYTPEMIEAARKKSR